MKTFRFYLALLVLLSLFACSNPQSNPTAETEALRFPIVFVSRQIPKLGSVYYPEGGMLPGVQPYSRFTPAAPSKLLVLEPSGSIRTLIDGSNPTPASLNLIDVNAPDVSYEGKKILFAGLPKGRYQQTSVASPGAWRIYVINIDGTGLKQLTSKQTLDLSQFGPIASVFTTYDDTDPVWLPDGRMVFSSTRYPSFGMYGAARSSNLFITNADGKKLHRITTERNGAERPLVDPLTGRIVYSRWWRNFRFASDSMKTVPDPEGGYKQHLGLIAANQTDQAGLGNVPGNSQNLNRNAWQLVTINPDGTDLKQFAGGSGTFYDGQDGNHAYGGSFTTDGNLFANYFPMLNGTEAAGFGGIRFYMRGPNGYTPVIGITYPTLDYVKTNPTSFGVYKGSYAAEPEVLPSGSLIISWARDTQQDYGLYTLNANGSGRRLLYDHPGTSELRARVIRPRPLPPIISDTVTTVVNVLPPKKVAPYTQDGIFVFDALNVYFNAPVDSNIISAMPVGSAKTMRSFIDHQRDEQYGSLERFDWPILLDEVIVNPNGSVRLTLPANVPLFEQIRSARPGYKVPLTGPSGETFGGAAHVAGLNYGRPGAVTRCVGCHAGHSMISVPANPADALFSNLAPGAVVSVSSSTPYVNTNVLVDRKVQTFSDATPPWRSEHGKSPNKQWIELTFPVPVTVRTVRLYNLPKEQGENNTLQVTGTRIKLFSDTTATQEVSRKTSGTVSVDGTDIAFSDVKARVVQVEFTGVTGHYGYEGTVASLAEIEVIARGEAP
jgi:WD40-like Beta Propeller Repeat